MFKSILTTVCTAALLSAGSVAIAEGDTNTTNYTTNNQDGSVQNNTDVADGGTQTNTSNSTFENGSTQNVADQNNDQNQGSLSNQSNVGNNSNSNSSGNLSVDGNYTDTSTSTSNSNNTSIANQNGYVTSVPIIASAGTCLGSTGTTLSAAGIGIGSSSTVVDDACNERQQQQLDANIHAQEAVTRANSVRLLNELGLAPAALSLLCQDPSIRIALKAGLEPVVYNKVCKVYEPDLSNLTAVSQY